MALSRAALFSRRVIAAAPRRALSTSARGVSRGASSGRWQTPVAASVLAGVAMMGLAAADEAQCGLFGVDEEVVNQLEEKLRRVEVTLAGKTNSAFVFIKPHACKGNPGQVEAMVRAKFAAAGIRVTGEGDMSAETIDEKKYIDTHYGAIASKAVSLKPSELNVPDKGKAEFQKLFGMSWDDALKQGLIYNAMDGAAKLGVDGFQLEKKWGKLNKKGPKQDMVKFGGGFYCGKVDGIFVMNGFYMSMRAAYCAPGEKIHWLTVSWPTDSLSWADFRGEVLGATDPSTAPAGSIRREILDKYKSLGLKSKPNTGDNGVHASASPFEALAERVNWLGASYDGDDFGRGMLAAGISEATFKSWSQDAQVTVPGQAKKMSVFDHFEDKDADDVLKMSTSVQ